MTLYYYNASWQVSTSGVPDAETSVENFPFTFRELFWKVWDEVGYKIESLSPDYCYMFELMTPYNQVVVKIKENRLVLHGARDMITLQEMDAQTIAHSYGFDTPRVFPFTNMKEVIEATKIIKPEEGEGFVVRDINFNRIKIKSEDYVRALHLKDSVGASMRSVIEVFQKNEIAEVLSYLPQYKTLFDEVSMRYTNLEVSVQLVYDSIKHIETQKEFALEALKTNFASILFGLRSGRINTVDEGLRNLKPDILMKLLQFKVEDIIAWTIGLNIK